MAQTPTTPPKLEPNHQVPAKPLPGLVFGTLTRVACKCSTQDDADFLIKADRIVCAACGKELLCTPPILGVFRATCACCCSRSIKTTFVLNSKGTYVCTWCGLTR